MSTPQSNGGIARAEKLSPERRAAIARTAADARWSNATAKPRAPRPDKHGWYTIDSAPNEEVVLLYWPSPKPDGSYALGWQIDGRMTWPGSETDAQHPTHWSRLRAPVPNPGA